MAKKPDDEQPPPKQKRSGHGEGSIYRRKDGRWVGEISLEDGKRKSFYGKTRKEAYEKMQKALQEQKQGTLATGPQQKLKDYLEQWLEDVHKPTLRLSSYSRYRRILDNHILPAFGHIQVQKLTPQQIQAFYARKLKEGLSPRTLRGIHTVLHSALDNAMRWNLVARNVCDSVSLPRIERHEMHVLTVEQVQQLLDTVKGHHLEAFFVLALVTGMRRGELLALKWKDIDLAEGMLQVQRAHVELKGKGVIESEPKTAKGRRTIPLPPFAVEVLKRHRVMHIEKRQKANAWQERDLVFCTAHGTPYSAGYVRKVFKPLLRKAHLPDIRFHDLRHSAATLLLSLGIHPKVVQERLGHSTISLTMDLYSHVLPTMQKDAATKLNDILERKSEGDV